MYSDGSRSMVGGRWSTPLHQLLPAGHWGISPHSQLATSITWDNLILLTTVDPEVKRQKGPLCGGICQRQGQAFLLLLRGREKQAGFWTGTWEANSSSQISPPSIDRFFFGKSSSCPCVPLIYLLLSFEVILLFGK